MAYALVGGHNAIVPGASGCGYKEHEVARQMVEKVATYLRQLGETVHICTDDVGKTQTAVWSNAVKNCNNAIGSSGRAISIHLNASGGTGTGTEVLTMTDSNMAKALSAAVASVLGVRDRGVKDGSKIGFINSTKATADLIELCFIDNPADMEKLRLKFDDVAKAIAETLTGKKLVQPTATAQDSQQSNAPGEIKYIYTGGYAGPALLTIHDYLFKRGHGFDCKRGKDGSIIFLVGPFDTSQPNWKEAYDSIIKIDPGMKLYDRGQASDWRK